MSVFVTGANGYIGFAVCRQLRQHGHTVYGLVRSIEGERMLKQIEVIPCLGSIQEIDKFLPIINRCSAIVDNVNDSTAAGNKLAMELAAKAGATRGQKLKYIYTSGCLSYGDNPGKVLTEEDAPVSHPAFVWRNKLMSEILKDDRFFGVVTRPGYVYGGNSGHYISPLWKKFLGKDKIEVVGNPDKTWSWIHVDDNADAYRRIVEAPDRVVAGKIYNIADFTRATHRQVTEAMARAGGAKGEIVVVPATGGFDAASDLSCLMSSKRLHDDLGWYPNHVNFLDNIHIYFEAYQASL